MHVLQVVHALPAATYGGTELYTQWLSEALADDHEVTVATPRGAETEIAGATVRELPDPVDWVDTSGMDSGLESGVVHESVDGAFEALLDDVDPDVTHFQHLKYASASMPSLCRERSIPTLLTLHDFWTMCHRGQLHRPDGVPCSGPESVAKCTACYGEAVRRAGDGRSPYGEDAVGETVAADPTGELVGDDPGCDRAGPSGGLADATDPDGALRDGGHTDDPEPGAGPGSAPNGGRVYEPEERADVSKRTGQLSAAREATDLLVSPSRFLRDTFVEYGTPRDAIVQCRNGIRTANYRDTGFDPDEGLVVGYAGRVSPEKGVHVLIEAFDRVEGDAELIVFGVFDPEGDEYHARLADAADERVTFHGFYEENATPSAAVDVVVVPSLWYENSPLVIQEAFASNVPVIAGAFGGMAEMVRDGTDGLTYPRGDVGALADHLQHLVDDPSFLRELRRGIEAPKDLDEHAGEIETLYDAVSEQVERREQGGSPA